MIFRCVARSDDGNDFKNVLIPYCRAVIVQYESYLLLLRLTVIHEVFIIGKRKIPTGYPCFIYRAVVYDIVGVVLAAPYVVFIQPDCNGISARFGYGKLARSVMRNGKRRRLDRKSTRLNSSHR